VTESVHRAASVLVCRSCAAISSYPCYLIFGEMSYKYTPMFGFFTTAANFTIRQPVRDPAQQPMRALPDRRRQQLLTRPPGKAGDEFRYGHVLFCSGSRMGTSATRRGHRHSIKLMRYCVTWAGAHRLRDQRAGDVRRRVRRVVEVGRRAALQRARDVGNVAVGVDVFAIGEVGRFWMV
jgi:hypothetical protein